MSAVGGLHVSSREADLCTAFSQHIHNDKEERIDSNRIGLLRKSPQRSENYRSACSNAIRQASLKLAF
jgi:hypothetical protein